jgi:hypothetical protein
MRFSIPTFLRRRGAALLLGFWGAPLLLMVSVLMGAHWLTLPAPGAADPTLARAVLASTAGERGSWHMLHVLYADCRCSQRVLDYIVERSTPPDVAETVLLVGHVPARTPTLEARGIRVIETTADQLQSDFGIESAPVLIIADARGSVRYVGGHAREPQARAYEDLAILQRLRTGLEHDALAVYGCAVSRELQSRLDPIGVKYSK